MRVYFTHSISEDISAVFAKVNARLMGGMMKYCSYLRRLAFGKHTYTYIHIHILKTAKYQFLTFP